MRVCFRIGGMWRCFYVPPLMDVLFKFKPPVEEPKVPRKPPPDGPPDYEALLADAALVAHVQAVAAHASDESVRDALHAGVERALKTMQERAGDDVRIGGKELELSAS